LQDPRLYVATRHAVFFSDDEGLTWQGARTGPPPYIGALLADPKRPGHLYAGSSEGVYRTTDGGMNWLPFSKGLASGPSALAVSPDGRWLHAGTLGGGVFTLDLEARAATTPVTPTPTFTRTATPVIRTPTPTPPRRVEPVPGRPNRARWVPPRRHEERP
jgi:hypothetical protein